MNIVLEGPDNAGKSTLAGAISEAVGWPVKFKEGKPATYELVLEKIKFYLTLDGCIIDRHPCISQTIFGAMRNDPPVPDMLMEGFFWQKPFIIYCRCTKLGLKGHEASPTDTPDHLAMLKERQADILAAYDSWMAAHAHVIYHDWEELPRIVNFVQGVLNERG